MVKDDAKSDDYDEDEEAEKVLKLLFRHKNDHIQQNISLASHINELKQLNQTFKRTVLAKNNR